MPSGFWSRAPTKELRMTENERRKCKVPGCHEPRRRYGGVCKKHQSPDNRYGHGLCQRIPTKVIEHHRKSVERIMKKNLDHPRIADAMVDLDRLMFSAVHGPAPHARELSRLYKAGVRAKDIFTEAATVYLIEHEDDSRSYVRDRRSLITQVGYVSLRLAPAGTKTTIANTTGQATTRYKTHSGGKRRSFGKFLLHHYESVFIALVAAVMSSLKAREEREKRRKMPLELDLSD